MTAGVRATNPARLTRWVLGAVLINVALFSLLAVLSRDRKEAPDRTDAYGVNLVAMPPPEPPVPEETAPPEPPDPTPPPDFQPELTPPSFELDRAALDAAIVLDPGLFEMRNLEVASIFNAGELDARPEALVRMAPDYPYRARQRFIEGVVQVKLLVNTDGSVGEVHILGAEPAGVFEDAVRQTVPHWKFKPGQVAGEAVASWLVTNVRFTLDR